MLLGATKARFALARKPVMERGCGDGGISKMGLVD